MECLLREILLALALYYLTSLCMYPNTTTSIEISAIYVFFSSISLSLLIITTMQTTISKSKPTKHSVESAASSPSRWLPLLYIMAILASACSFQPTTKYHRHANQRGFQIHASPNVNTNDEVSRLKQSAERLRAEALEAQEKLADRRAKSTVDVTTVKDVEYDAVSDSCWEIS